MSAFELKNKLVELAKHRGERMMLNAGRGNPNWIALEPRAAFFRLGEFAVAEASRVALAPEFGGLPKKRGIAGRLRAFLAAGTAAAGSALLERGIDYGQRRHGFDQDLLVGEWVDGILGDHYPLPVRMLPHAEALVRDHLVAELFATLARISASGTAILIAEPSLARIADIADFFAARNKDFDDRYLDAAGCNPISSRDARHELHRDLQFTLIFFLLAILAAWRDTHLTQRFQSVVSGRRVDSPIHRLDTCIVTFNLRSLPAIHVWRRGTCLFTEHV